jgi:RNA polymerase sigma-70 factor (ECF subfamily)
MNALPTRGAIVQAFRLAAARDDIHALAALLDPDVVALTDGAGDVIAPTIALRGPDEVIAEVVTQLSPASGAVVIEQTVNAAPALVVRMSDRVVAIFSFGIARGLVTHVWITRSPQKLQRWNTSE